MERESETEVALLSLLTGSPSATPSAATAATTTIPTYLEPLGHHLTQTAYRNTSGMHLAPSTTFADGTTNRTLAATPPALFPSDETGKLLSDSPTTKKRKDRALRQMSPNKKPRRVRRTAQQHAATPNGEDKNHTPIFKKTSPHYKTFIEMCRLKGWRDKLPQVKRDPDLAAFLETTGFSRAQVARKFHEYVRSLWFVESGMKEYGDRMLEEAGFNLQDHIPKSANPRIARRKNQPIDDAPKRDAQENLVAKLPPMHLGHDGLPGWQQPPPLQQPSMTHNSNTAGWSFPLPPSPTKRTLSTFSEKSPLSTRKFYGVSPTPFLQPGTHRLCRDLSWARSASAVMMLQPPSLMRIQTAEVNDMLRGSILSHPTRSTPQQQCQVIDWSQQQLQQLQQEQRQQQRQLQQCNMPFTTDNSGRKIAPGQPPVLGNYHNAATLGATASPYFQTPTLYADQLSPSIPFVPQRRRNSVVNFLPLLANTTSTGSISEKADSWRRKQPSPKSMDKLNIDNW